MKKQAYCNLWKIDDIRSIYKELSVAMNDDMQLYSAYEDEYRSMEELTKEKAEHFTLL
jgi:hypothetical protein